MDLQLVGKKALVTGSTAGIGLATANGLYREGASVCVNGRNPKRVEEAVRQVKASPTIGTPEVTGVAADLGTAEGVVGGEQPPRVASWSTTWATSSPSLLIGSPTKTGSDSFKLMS